MGEGFQREHRSIQPVFTNTMLDRAPLVLVGNCCMCGMAVGLFEMNITFYVIQNEGEYLILHRGRCTLAYIQMMQQGP